MKSNPIEELNQIRSDLQFFAQTVKTEFQSSRETSLARTSLEEAMMFTGNTLKEINEGVTPYVNSQNPLNTTIDPLYVHETVKPGVIPEEWSEWEYVQKVKWLRMMLDLIVTKFRLINVNSPNLWVDPILTNAQLLAINAKAWLGMELARLRDLAEKTT